MSVPTISVLVADDHTLVRQMLVQWLNSASDITVVADVADADAAVAEAERLKPDIALLDIDMPGQFCFEAARVIRRVSRDTHLVFLSAFFHDRYIEQALAVEALGYISKDEPPDKVLEALRTIAAGGTYYSADIRMRIVIDDRGRSRLSPECRTRGMDLTRREREILHYVARGLSNKEIAAVTHLTVRTVETHCTRLMAKLGIHGRIELTRYAIREGLCEA